MHFDHQGLLAQANKNTLVKAMVGTGGVMAAVAFKAWWQPSFWAALSGGFDFRMRQPKFGLTLGTENYGNIRFVNSELRSFSVTLAITYSNNKIWLHAEHLVLLSLNVEGCALLPLPGVC
jgi:hypothetical protein